VRAGVSAILIFLLLASTAGFVRAQEVEIGTGRHNGGIGNAHHKRNKPAKGATDPWWDLNGTAVGAGTTPTGTWSTSVANWNANLAGTGSLGNWVNGSGPANFSAGSDATGSYTVTVSGTITATGIVFEDGTITLAGTATPVLTLGASGVTIDNTDNGPITFGSTLGTVLAGGSTGADQTWANNSAQAFVVNTLVQIGDGSTLTLGGSGSGSLTGGISENNSNGSHKGKLNKTGNGTFTLSGASTYTGTTTISAGTLQFAKQVSLYNNNTASWTASNITVASGATAAFNVGGTGEFTSANIDTLKGLGLGATGFTSGSFLGLDTTNATGGNFTYASVIANPNSGANVLGLTKLGTGTLTLTGASTYTGATTINGGTLKLDNNNTAAARLASTSGITVNSGGTLLLAQTGVSTDRINNSATVTLNGGTFNTAGLSEGTTGAAGVGALTLQDNSIIDLGAGASILHFADSHLAAWTASKILEIDNWSGSTSGGGTDQLIFGTTSSGLTASQIAEVQFLNPNGFAAGTYGATILGNGELVPTAIPEPGTWVTGGLTLAGLVCWQRRTNSKKLKR
jgi:autotransporter-associated beta strand protein